MEWNWSWQASANKSQEITQTHRPGSTEQSWCEFAGHSQSHMGEKRLRTTLRWVRERKNGHNQQEHLQTSHRHQQQTDETRCVCVCLYLYSIVKPSVGSTSHCDILTHSRRASFNRSMKSSKDRCIFHLIEHTQSSNTWKRKTLPHTAIRKFCISNFFVENNTFIKQWWIQLIKLIKHL